ncbi:MAG: 4a-hydroxytetrahydrobiopterin dehydratase [Anaerolineales bacterium]|jgi:4a-hydroxytetrahydrobiopterin dehydratase
MNELANMNCVQVKRGGAPLSAEQIAEYKPQLPDWKVVEKEGIKRLERAYKFQNFREALEFTNQVGEIAEQEDHHPLIQTEWGKVTLNWWTHVIGGLHRNDFIMAAKSDQRYQSK